MAPGPPWKSPGITDTKTKFGSIPVGSVIVCLKIQLYVPLLSPSISMFAGWLMANPHCPWLVYVSQPEDTVASTGIVGATIEGRVGVARSAVCVAPGAHPTIPPNN